jgi:transaldolase
MTAKTTEPLQKLADLGQSVWIDYLSRELLTSGELARLMRDDAVVGVTSNPTIFHQAFAHGGAYDEQIRDLIAAGTTDPKEVFLELATVDVADAAELLLPVWTRTCALDGYVSIEVDPSLAADARATIAEATRLHEWINRPNVYVKIPATDAGIGAIEDMIAVGRSINVTLIFSLERHRQVMEAYLHGLERLIESGGDPSQVHSVASFFISRVDTETDARLEIEGTPAALRLRGRLAIANAKLAYQNYRATFAGPRWQRLAEAGATSQRCLWASTSTKNPAYSDVLYVESLVGPDTVNTMPEETMRAVQDHGRIDQALTQGLAQATQLLHELSDVGIDYHEVVATLEEEGIAKFTAAFNDLLAGLEAKRPTAAGDGS